MSDPVFENNNPFTYFSCDRDPTETEPIVASSPFVDGWLIHWWNTSSKQIFQFQGGTNGSYLWYKVATPVNFASMAAPLLATVATTGSYNDLLNKPNLPGAQIQSDWEQTNISSLDYIKNKPAPRSQSSATRSLNSGFQVSAARDALVNYSVDVSCSLTLTSGQSGTVFLEIASDSGFTTNVQEIGRFTNSSTGTLTIGLNLVQGVTGNLQGYVPSGYYCRLRTANNTGTPTFTYRSGQEILL